jgi:hypothetical protein
MAVARISGADSGAGAAADEKGGMGPNAKVYSTVSADKPWEQVGGSYGEVVSPTGMSREMFSSLMRRRPDL